MLLLGKYQIQIFEIQPKTDVAEYPPAYNPESELDNVTAAPVLCRLMMCMKLSNWCINRSVISSVI